MYFGISIETFLPNEPGIGGGRTTRMLEVAVHGTFESGV